MPVVSLRPSSDVSVTDWETGTGSSSNLYAEIDETTVSSSDYIATEGGTAKFELTNPSAGITAATMRVRFRKDGDDEANLTVRLLQNNAPTTWNTADKTSNVSLSGGNLIATIGDEDFAGMRTVASYSSGKKYAEIMIARDGGDTNSIMVGFSNASQSLTSSLGSINNDSLAWYRQGQVVLAASTLDTISAYTADDAILCLAIDFDNEKFWARPSTDANWNDDVLANQNPATNTGGISFSTIDAGPYFLTMVVYSQGGDVYTLNTGASSYAGVRPAGFTNWTSGGEATVAEWDYIDIADTDTDIEIALTSPQFALISDPNDLRIEFEASVSSVSANGLLTGLVSYWPMQEAANVNRVDVHGSNDFVDITTLVGQSTGHVEANCADLLAGGVNQSLRMPDGGLAFHNAFSMSMWVNPDTVASLQGIFGKGAPEFRVYSLGSPAGTIYWEINSSGQAHSSVVISASAWQLLVFVYDPAGSYGVSLDGATAVTTAVTSPIPNGTDYFWFGQNENAGNLYNGKVEQIGFWNRVLTAGEITALWNGGAGLPYSSFTA
jgi:hypothetical protein